MHDINLSENCKEITENIKDFNNIFQKTKWLSSISLDMNFIDKSNFIDSLQIVWNFLQQNENIFLMEINESFSDFKLQHKKKINQKTICDLRDYCFYKKDTQLIQEIKHESFQNGKLMDQLISNIRSCISERSFIVDHFSLLIKSEMYDSCDEFLRKKPKQKDFVFFNCFPEIAKKLDDVVFLELLVNHDFDWSCSQASGGQLYNNIFHLLIEIPSFKKNAKDCFKLFKMFNVHLRYEIEWKKKNDYGINISDFCEFLGYHHLFLEPSVKIEKNIGLNMDEHIWNNTFEYIELENKIQFSFWFSRINQHTRNIVKRIYLNELNKIFNETHSLQYFIILFCSLFYDLDIVNKILLKVFHENLCLRKDEADYIFNETLKWNHDKKNKVVHFEK